MAVTKKILQPIENPSIIRLVRYIPGPSIPRLNTKKAKITANIQNIIRQNRDPQIIQPQFLPPPLFSGGGGGVTYMGDCCL